jgi:GntR family transcriptional regulator / MocR family aminotransferase
MFLLDHNSLVPLYTQLYLQIRELILAGKMPSDSKLPSVRDLARELSVSRNTAENSYLELYAEGFIYSKPRSGYFVSALDQGPVPQSLPPEPPVDGPHLAAAHCAFDFHPARLDPKSFPAATWRKCFLDALKSDAPDLSQYGDPQGERGLRSNIQKYLERSRGVVCEPEQIVLCSGLQHSLDIVAHILQRGHRTIALENPGYFLPRSVFLNHSYQVNAIAVGPGGLDLEALKKSSSTIAYVTPSHQFPLGHVMPVANRLKLIDWAESGDPDASGARFILEDDYDSELRYHGKPIPSLQGLRPGGNIIYLGSFSKILSPALRMSYLVLPLSLLPAYRQAFRDYYCSVSLLEQGTLVQFMEQGHWERHLRRMRILYKKKHDALLSAIERHFGSRAVVLGQGAGLHVVLQLLGESRNETQLIQKAQSDGIGLFPFSVTYAGDAPDSRLFFLGFGAMSAQDLERGVEQLQKSWYC